MLEVTTILFLVLVGVGALIQTLTGFAMGLIIMAGVALFGLADIAFAAVVVSFISFLNASIALRAGIRQVDWRYIRWLFVGLIPALLAGIVLLDFLSAHFYEALRLILGVFVMAGGVMLMISPAALSQPSGNTSTVFFGALGGVLGGLYSAGGAPLAYFMYRQPMSVSVIRFTLLMVFALSTGSRALFVGVAGHIDETVMMTTLVSIPVVIVVTLVVSKLLHLVPDQLVRKIVFVVLMLLGAVLVGDSAIALLK